MADAAPANAHTTVLPAALPAALPRRTMIHVSDVALPVAVALWAIGLSQTHATSLGAFGLLTKLPVVFYAGVVLLVLSAMIELAIANASQWRMGLHVGALTIMLYGTAALVYPEGRYSWLYKTIGVVQYVTAHGQLNSSIDIYQNWPGFFALAAWFDKVAGVASPLAYAKWAQVVFELAALPLLYLIYDGLSLTFRQRWMALLLYPAANWIGQDYLSPQGLGTLFSLAIMALTMRYLFTGNQGPSRPRRRWLRRKRVTEPGQADSQAAVAVKRGRLARARQRLARPPRAVWHRLRAAARRVGLYRAWAVVMGRQAETSGGPGGSDKTPRPDAALSSKARQLLAPLAQADGYASADHADLAAGLEPAKRAVPLADLLVRPGRRAAFLITILLLFFVLTSVHELSPYIVAVQLVVLAVARPLRPRWLPLAMLVIAVAYLLPRLSFVTSHYGLLSSFGSFFGNATPPSASASTYAGSIPASQLLIQRSAEGLSVLMWLLALVGAWRLRHSGRTVLALLVLTFSPVLVLFGQAYGNEGILRVYLFSLPWAAALAAAAVEPGTLSRKMVPHFGGLAAAVAAAARAVARRLRALPAAVAAAAVKLGSVARATVRRLRAWAAALAAVVAAAAVRLGTLARAAVRHIRGWASALAAVRPGTTARAMMQRVRAWAAAVAAVRPRTLAQAMVQRLRAWATALAAVRPGPVARAVARRPRAWAAALAATEWGTMARTVVRRLRGWAAALAAAVAAVAVTLGTLARAMARRLRAVGRRFAIPWVMPILRWVRAPIALCVALALFFLAFFGDDAVDTFSQSEVTTIVNFLQSARPGPLYVAEDNVPADDTATYYLWPSNVIFGARDGAPLVNQATANIATVIAENSLTLTGGKQPAYVLIAPSMVPYNSAYAQAPPNSFSILEKSLASSKQWKLVAKRDGTVIYEFPPAAGS